MILSLRFAGFITAVLAFSSTLFAQEVQWATEVLSFSSELSTPRYSVKQVLGRPDKCPASGDSPMAWAGKADRDYSNSEERIKVGFAKPMQIQQVAIAENYNPGSVSKVILTDVANKEYVIFEGEGAPVAAKSRVMNITFLKTAYKVKAVEIVLQVGRVPGQNQIDAIGISENKTPYKAEPNVAKGAKIEGKRENLGPGINSRYDEVLPVISPDGKTLYLDRKDHPQNYAFDRRAADNIWYSEIQPDGKWGVLRNIGQQLNGGWGNYTMSITPDGNTMLLGGVFDNRTYNTNQAPISFSRRESGGWGKPKRIQIDSFYNLNKFMEVCLANDGKTILLTLQRWDSHSERDLYVSFLRGDTTWSAPVNLGPTINTLAEEATPFLASDNKTLYFSSTGYSGYGTNDMYVSRRLDESWTKWSTPENLGPDFNTPNWDAYYTLTASGEYAYFVSYDESYGGGDIFRAKLPLALRPDPVVLVSGTVIDKKTGKPLEATIKYELLPGGKDVGEAHSSPTTGEYKIILPAGAMYGFRAEAKGYIAVNENLNLKKVTEYTEMKRDLELVPPEVGSVVRMNNIFFETGKAELKSESNAELDRLVDALKTSPAMELLIGGHTDNVGNDNTNKSLSDARARAVKTYLVGKGIKTDRLKTAGFGKSKPVATNDTDEGRQLNRRVEFTIMKQ
ncbi:MAG TPA: OmpA family protein [Candidatus Kapabacteria bacterium]